MSTVGRYAPSPTGDLHLGNVRTALLAWLAARSAGGRFLMRVEDIDLDRTVPGSEERILDDLRWLGLAWDGPPWRQSERFDLYEELLGRLAARGLLYACTCSRRELNEASAPHGPEGPVYAGTCRACVLAPAQLPRLRRAGEKPRAFEFAIRLRVSDETLTFDDALAGCVVVDLAREVGDFVVVRRDGLIAYQFACAVDDALSGVTQVVRGADLLASTPRQLVIQRALDLAAPSGWIHVPLMGDASGARLAKRTGGLTLRARRDAGATPDALLGELAASAGLIATPAPTTPDALLPRFAPWLASSAAASAAVSRP